MKNFIKELKYAKKLHRDAMKLDEDILKQKDFVINLLEKKRPKREDIEKAIDFIEFWKETHENWVELIKINSKWKKIGGDISWQKRWIKLYDNLLKKLYKLLNQI